MKVVIVGAGLAGLAAGCELADAGHTVTLLERRPWAGGKTYSFRDRETGEQVDNGQHIAMRCTTEYVRFLERIGTAHLVKWQSRMLVPVFDAAGRRSDLRAAALPAPLHMLPSFALYRHLPISEKLRIARAIVAIRLSKPKPTPYATSSSVKDRRTDRGTDRRTEHGTERGHSARAGSTTRPASLDVSDESNPASSGDENAESFGDWLRKRGQSERGIRDFWDLIVVPALNCRCDDVSAAQALFVFREGFLKSPESAAVGVPAVGLSALHVEPAVRYIEARGGELRTGATAMRVELRDGRVAAVVLASGDRVACDACVVALPPHQAAELVAGELRAMPAFAAMASMRMSPIVNLHLWFDGPVAPFDFAAFTGCDLQWIFNRTHIEAGTTTADGAPEHLVVSLSAAERYMALDKPALLDLLLPELHRALPASASRTLLHAVVIKEPNATFVPSPGLRRPGARTPVANLFLAGAYTDTGWPATMESAVRSGYAAASAVEEAASQQQPPRRELTDVTPPVAVA